MLEHFHIKTMAPSNSQCVLDMNISFDMERLFDHYNFDHIPTEKRLSVFKQRDLAHVKHYKAAVKIFGGPSKRTRVHVAPPMETLLKHRLGEYLNEFKPPPSPSLNEQLKPRHIRLQTEDKIEGKEEIIEGKEETIAGKEEIEYVTQYNNLITERKQLRNNLDNLSLNEVYLARKINKSEIERRVQARYRAKRLQKPEVSLLVENISTAKLQLDIPSVAVPPVDGLHILDTFLSLNHMRLMDLFHMADKNKNWSLTRQEFLNAVTQTDIPLTEAEVDAMFVGLDADLDDKLSYQELNKGLQLWQKETRFAESQSDENTKKPIGIKNTSEEHEVRSTTSGAETASKPALKAKSKGIRDYVSASSKQRQEIGDSRLNTDMYYKEAANFSGTYEKQSKENTVPSHEVNTQETEDLYDPTMSPMKSTQRKPEKSHLVITRNGKDTPDSEARPGSHRTISDSRTSTPSSLEPPPPDLRKEVRIPASLEDAVDIRKHDRVVLSRNKIRRQLTPDQQTAFSELPGVIKVGYKPIDDHCSESTLGGQTADVVNQFRQAELKEYFNIKKLFEQRGLPFTQKILDRVILYPGDQPVSELKRTIDSPVGQLTDKERPFTQIKSVRDNASHWNLGAPDTKSGFASGKYSNSTRNTGGVGDGPDTKSGFASGKYSNSTRNPDNVSNGIDTESPQKKTLECDQKQGQTEKGHGYPDTKSGFASGKYSNSTRNPDNVSNGIDTESPQKKTLERDQKQGQTEKGHGYPTSQDLYPPGSSVRLKGHTENLSSDKALISRKVNNRTTSGMNSQYTKHLPHRFQRTHNKSKPHAAWPDYLSHKLRIYMDSDLVPVDGRRRLLGSRDSGDGEGYGGRGNAVFQHTAQPKRAYPGYNNDLLTWPVGENGVRYGNIDEHRLVK